MIETAYAIVFSMRYYLVHEASSVQFMFQVCFREMMLYVFSGIFDVSSSSSIEYILARKPTNSTMAVPAVSSLKQPNFFLLRSE